MMPAPFDILFLRPSNAARSIQAEALMHRGDANEAS
jgi:hypothetical protein